MSNKEKNTKKDKNNVVAIGDYVIFRHKKALYHRNWWEHIEEIKIFKFPTKDMDKYIPDMFRTTHYIAKVNEHTHNFVNKNFFLFLKPEKDELKEFLLEIEDYEEIMRLEKEGWENYSSLSTEKEEYDRMYRVLKKLKEEVKKNKDKKNRKK